MTQLVIAMIVLAIACDSGRPPWVAPAPAAPTETAPGDDHHKRAAALERLRTKLAGNKRARTAVEADAALTNAYVDLEIAYGFARLGRRERAAELVTGAKAALASVATDAVHAAAIALYVARIDHSTEDGIGTPRELEATIAGLDRVARYKLDRLREQSRIVGGSATYDAIGDFSASGKGPAFPTLPADDEARAKTLSEIADAAGEPYEHEHHLLVVLEMVATMPPAIATPVLDHVLASAASLPPVLRAGVAAEALFVASRLGDRAVVASLVTNVAALKAGEETDLAIANVVRGLGKLGMSNELPTLLGTLENALGTDDAAVAAIAGGWFVVGKPDRATKLLDAVNAHVGADMIPARRKRISRALGFA